MTVIDFLSSMLIGHYRFTFLVRFLIVDPLCSSSPLDPHAWLLFVDSIPVYGE